MIRDLLAPSSGFLELREDPKGVNVVGLMEVETSSVDEVRGGFLAAPVAKSVAMAVGRPVLRRICQSHPSLPHACVCRSWISCQLATAGEPVSRLQ